MTGILVVAWYLRWVLVFAVGLLGVGYVLEAAWTEEADQ